MNPLDIAIQLYFQDIISIILDKILQYDANSAQSIVFAIIALALIALIYIFINCIKGESPDDARVSEKLNKEVQL